MESVVAPYETLCEKKLSALFDMRPSRKSAIMKNTFVMLCAQYMPKSHKLGIILTSILLANDTN